MRQPPPGAAVACKSSSKPSSGVGRTSRRATSRSPDGRNRPLARGVARRRRRCGRPRRGSATALKPACSRGHHVARPLGHGRVRVVDDERLLRVQADGEERRLARPRAQQVHRDPGVRLQEAVAVERRLARALHAAEDHRLHCPDRTVPGVIHSLEPDERTLHGYVLARAGARADDRPRRHGGVPHAGLRLGPRALRRRPLPPAARGRARRRRPRADRPRGHPRRAARDDAAVEIGDVVPGAYGVCLAGGWASDCNERLGVVGDGVVHAYELDAATMTGR